MIKLPSDGHRPFADVASVLTSPEEPEGAVVGTEASKKQDTSSQAGMIPVAIASLAVGLHC